MFYHVGKAGLLKIIPGRSKGFTDAGEWADQIYKGRPTYLSTKKGRYPIRKGLKEYRIDPSAIDTEKLRADLPSLVDSGMNITGNWTGWWEESQEPLALIPYLNKDGEISLTKLVKLWQQAKDVTGTVAYQGNILLSSSRKEKIPFNELKHQHGGDRGHDTWWISLDPSNPPEWMGGRGSLTNVYKTLAGLKRAKK